MSELWRAVAGFEGFYEVSNEGRVRSLDRTTSSGRRLRGKILCAYPNNQGYWNVHLSKSGSAILKRVHRLVLEAFAGPCPEGMMACHFPDPNKANNAISNLRWGTQEENESDKKIHGTSTSGSRHPMAKLTPDSVSMIRGFLAAGKSQKQVALQFGVSHSMVNRIATGKNWKGEAA